MKRRLFCELCPAAYSISVFRCTVERNLSDMLSKTRFSTEHSATLLPYVAYSHSSLIRRTLGDVDPVLQENKAVNLGLAAPRISGILIRPGETFSFWKTVGRCDKKQGYREGLVIERGAPSKGIGGGMCQMTNLIHWMALHSPLTATEHHHHDGVDLFPDFGRQVPFGTGTSIFYNYIDYRLFNPTEQTFQLVLTVDEKYLNGELRCEHPLPQSYHVRAEDEHFTYENGDYYRCGEVVRTVLDKQSGNVISREVIKQNHARVLYDHKFCRGAVQVSCSGPDDPQGSGKK